MATGLGGSLAKCFCTVSRAFVATLCRVFAFEDLPFRVATPFSGLTLWK